MLRMLTQCFHDVLIILFNTNVNNIFRHTSVGPRQHLRRSGRAQRPVERHGGGTGPRGENLTGETELRKLILGELVEVKVVLVKQVWRRTGY